MIISINKIIKQFKTSPKSRHFFYAICALPALIFLLFAFEIYVPKSPASNDTITYIAKSGMGDDEIAKDLEKQGIIKNSFFFRSYVILSLQHSKLQAGKYSLSPNMSVYEIVRKMVSGEVIKQKITILEGWDISDIKKYFLAENVLTKGDFDQLVNNDFSGKFSFLEEKPKDIGLEGYLFPDTYEIYEGETVEEIFESILSNFDKKITVDLKNGIAAQKKSLFEIITVASMIEKEVKTMDDKKIVSGIVFKRLQAGMPLQIDSTVNYITGKSDAGAAIKDTKIDSPYNTYKYKGLPKGPISNPGMDSILAAINPKDSPYLYWLSSFSGKIIFSRTLTEHNIARAKYFR